MRTRQLSVRWVKREQALVYHHDRSASDGCMLAYYFEGMRWPENRTLAQELEYRGFDLTTLKFSIQRKTEPTPESPQENATPAGEGGGNAPR